MKSLEIAQVQHVQLLAHGSAKDLGNGWMICADRNHFNSVLLVSKHRPLLRSFEHGEPYHSFLRAQIGAEVHAENNPQEPANVVRENGLLQLH